MRGLGQMGVFYDDEEVTIYTVKYDSDGKRQRGDVVYGRTDTPDARTEDTVLEGRSYRPKLSRVDDDVSASRVIKVSSEEDWPAENLVEVYKTMSTRDRKIISGLTQSLVKSGAIDNPEAKIDDGDEDFTEYYLEASQAAQRDNEVSPRYAYSDEELKEKYGEVEDPELYEEMYTDNISEPDEEEEEPQPKKKSVVIESTDDREVFLDQKLESVEQFSSGESREIPRAEFQEPVAIEKKVSFEDVLIVQRMIKKGLSDSDIADIMDALTAEDVAKLRESS